MSYDDCNAVCIGATATGPLSDLRKLGCALCVKDCTREEFQFYFFVTSHNWNLRRLLNEGFIYKQKCCC